MTAKQLFGKECFNKEGHDRHVWHEQYVCTGMGTDEDDHTIATQRDVLATLDYFNELYNSPDPEDEVKHFTERGQKLLDSAAAQHASVLDGREAYGNRVVNMRQQADMWNAYLDGRTIEAHDVPIMFVLTKLHRLGRMPDYADNYNDVDGYMQIAREVIGSNMVEAATAKEYAEKKAGRWDEQNQRTLEEELLAQQLRDSVAQIVPRRSGKSMTCPKCRHALHVGQCYNMASDNDCSCVMPAHPYENVERDAEVEDRTSNEETIPVSLKINGVYIPRGASISLSRPTSEERDAEAEAMSAYDSERLGLKPVDE